MKYILILLVFWGCLLVGCSGDDLQLQRALNDVTLASTPTNWVQVQKIPALVSRQDSMDMVSPLFYYFQKYDSFCIERVQPKRNIAGNIYTVTNDSAVYIISFFSPTRHLNYHPIYFNNKYSAVDIAQQ